MSREGGGKAGYGNRTRLTGFLNLVMARDFWHQGQDRQWVMARRPFTGVRSILLQESHPCGLVIPRSIWRRVREGDRPARAVGANRRRDVPARRTQDACRTSYPRHRKCRLEWSLTPCRSAASGELDAHSTPTCQPPVGCSGRSGGNCTRPPSSDPSRTEERGRLGLRPSSRRPRESFLVAGESERRCLCTRSYNASTSSTPSHTHVPGCPWSPSDR